MPLEKIFAESSHPIRKLPIGLLSYTQCETLLDKLAVREPAIWRDWKTCRTFKTLVADFASIPRKLETLLRCVRVAVTADASGRMSIHDLDFKDIYEQLQNSTVSVGPLMRYASSLIAAAMLSTPVERDAFVLETDSSSWTYGALEEAGHIVLATTAHGGTIVQLPYSIFRKLVATKNGTDPLTGALRRACNLTDNYSDCFSWESLEDLHANIEAIREMLLAKNKDEDKAMSLNEFYCTSYPISSAVEDMLEFELRTHCHVNAVTSSFPAQQSEVDLHDNAPCGSDSSGSLLDAGSTIIKNAPGALFDTFTVRQILGDDRLLVCGQQKFYQTTEVTKEMARDLAAKVALRLSDAVEHVLVIVESPPDHCVILTGAALERFYGPVFSGRVILAMSGTRVDINTATYLELRTVPGIGDTLAKRIINIRTNAPIASWSDALTRVPRLPPAS